MVMRTRRSAVLSLGASLICACTGSMAAPSDAGGDSPANQDAGGDSAPESAADADAGQHPDVGDGSYASYCAQYLDSDLACVATKCCEPFATCYQSTACSDFEYCLNNGCPDAGDADPQTAYAECIDACTAQYPVGAQQSSSYINCLDMNCYE